MATKPGDKKTNTPKAPAKPAAKAPPKAAAKPAAALDAAKVMKALAAIEKRLDEIEKRLGDMRMSGDVRAEWATQIRNGQLAAQELGHLVVDKIDELAAAVGHPTVAPAEPAEAPPLTERDEPADAEPATDLESGEAAEADAQAEAEISEFGKRKFYPEN